MKSLVTVFLVCLLATQSVPPVCHGSSDDCDVCSVMVWNASACDSRDVLKSFKTDEVAYVGATSDITAEVYSNVIDYHPKLFYRFCYVYNVTSSNHSTAKTIGCVISGSYARQEVNWTENGLASVIVEVYPENRTVLLACGSVNTSVYNAGNTGIDLTVEVVSLPTSVEVDHYLELGNVTFIPNVTTQAAPTLLYYRYGFGDGSPETGSNAENFTHKYIHPGNYTYWVEAIAVTNNSKACQTRSSNYMVLQDPITAVDVTINSGEPFLEGASITINVAVNGSLPVSVCWHTEPKEQPSIQQSNYSSICNNTLWTLNASSVSYQYRFTDIGEFYFVADFANNVSVVPSKEFPFTVLKDHCNKAITENCTSHSNITSFGVDTVAYVGALSDLVVEVNPNVTVGHSSLLYRFCSNRTNDSAFVSNITTGNATVVLQHKWTAHLVDGEPKVIMILVQVFSSDTSDVLLGCATSETTVYKSEPNALTLDVKLNDTQQPHFPITDQTAEDHYLIVGNITFVCNATASNGTVHPRQIYYHFTFGDGTPESEYENSTVTHSYNQTGRFSYAVEAIAVIDDTEAYHAVYRNYTILEAAVQNIGIHISGNNSVTQDAEAVVTISSGGSLPIEVCWHSERLVATSTTKHVSSTASLECLNNFTMTLLNTSSSAKMHMSFHEIGDYQFVATFQNAVSRQSGTFKFKVVPSSNAAVVASLSTAVVVVVVLIVIVVIVIVIVGVYIPYRGYKNKMTETANFRFVDLNDRASFWSRMKVKFRQLRDLFRRNHYQKVGLVNLSSEANVQSHYGSNGAHGFTPHESL